MVFENIYKLSDILSIVSIVLVIIGGIFTYYQWRRNVSLKRASYIRSCTNRGKSSIMST